MPLKLLTTESGHHACPLLIKHLLRTPLVMAPDEEIVYADRSRYTYAVLGQRVGRLAHVLAGLGATEGSTVAIMDWDSHRYLECYFAVPMVGAVLHTVNVRLSPAQIRYTLEHAAADLCIVNREFVALLEAMLPSLPRLRGVIVIDDEPSAEEAPLFAGEYEALLARSSPHFDFPDFDENAVATTFYTTGTTGLPKGVCFTHRQLVLHTLTNLGVFASAANGQSFRRGDVYMPITPMFHVHGWGMPYIATVLGVKQVYPGRYETASLLALRQREGVTFSHCVPTILQMLITAARECGISLAGWKMAIGGSALPAGLLRQALHEGMDVFLGYGMSETGPILTLTQLDDDMVAEGAVEARVLAGRPVPLVEVRVVDGAMNDLPHDGRSQGEIVVRAPWLTAAYLGDEEASRQLWQGGWLHTQDIGMIDGRGFLRITDRMKDVIKTGGEWVSSLAIEALISGHAEVAEAAVIGVANERWGERPIALVVVQQGADIASLPQRIRLHVMAAVDQGAISKFAVPDEVHIVPALSRTSVGKLDKKAMREKFSLRPS